MKKISILILVFSIFLRFYFFWEPSFSSDEAHYVMSATRVLNGVRGLVLRRDTNAAIKNLTLPFLQHAHGPMEFLVIIPAIPFADREFFVRLVFVLISILSLAIAFIWSKRVKNLWTASFLVLFVGTSLYAVLWSQTAMYQTLAISVTLLIILAVLSFEKKQNRKNLFVLCFLHGLSLLIFPDLIIYSLATLWLIFDKRKYINKKDLGVGFLIFFLVAGSFYIPWIIYGIVGSDPGNGFRFLVSHKLASVPDPVLNFKTFLSNFFLYPGVFIMLPFAFLSLKKIKKTASLRYVWLVVVVATFIYVFKSYLPYFYFVSLFSSFAYLASEGTVVFKNKRVKMILFAAIFVINILGLIPFFNKSHNVFVFSGEKNDEIKKIGETIRKCGISDEETYLSTTDFGRAEYYFGRQSTNYQDGLQNRIKLMEDFEKGGYLNVKYVHFVKGELKSKLEKKLIKKSLSQAHFQNDVLLIYKKCSK